MASENKKKDTTPETESKEVIIAPETESKETVATKKISDYFEIIGGKNKKFRLQNERVIDFRLGLPSDSLDLYKSGFKYIGLKSGAEVLFSDLSPEAINKLIAQAPRSEDVKVLNKALKK